MITLYRRRKSRNADEIQERLEDLVLAHRVVDVEDVEQIPEHRSPPVLVESDATYSGDEIEALLDEIGTEITVERQFSADACYIDPDNPTRCI